MSIIFNCKFCGRPIELDDSTRPGDNIKCRHCNVSYPLPDDFGGDESPDAINSPSFIIKEPPRKLPPDGSPDAEAGTAKKAAVGIFGFFEGIATAIVLLSIMAIILDAYYNSASNRRWRAQAKKKSCVANMKTIESAIELYQKKNNILAGTFPSITDLRNEGSLNVEPKCPGSGTYSIAVLSGTRVTVDIACTIHGTLSQQDGLDRDRGL